MASVDELYNNLVAEADRLGVSPEPSWRRDLAATYQGDPVTGIGARTSDDIYASILKQQAGRATSTAGRLYDSQSAEGRALYQSDSNARYNVEAPSIPAAVASQITTLGASEPAGATPTVGPVGLAYPDDPVRYSTNQQGAQYGYSGAGALPSGIYASGPSTLPAAAPADAGAVSPLVGWALLIGGAALVAYLVMRR